MRPIIMWLKRENSSKGVRRVPVNVRSLTGQFNGQEFESSLERDLLLLIHYDFGVDWYQSQPLTITYLDHLTKRKRQYTPDLLVTYSTDGRYKERKPLLCEVKYREDMAGQWKQLKPKFKAARAYAKARNWEFKILTEVEIRTPYLSNVKFLLNYRYSDFNENHYRRLASLLDKFGETDPQTLIQAAYTSKNNQGEALWTLWAMVARGWVGCDLNRPLSMTTPIWRDD